MTNKVEISAEPAAITLLAGDTAEVTVSIRNLGQTIDQLTLGIDGLEPDWYTVPVSSVSLFPNDQDDLRIVLHPPHAAESKPGPHPFRVNVTSQESPGEIATAEVTIQIRPPLELQLEMSPQRIVGRKGVYQIIVNNPADRETTVNLEARDAGKRLRYHFDPERLTVAGGGRSSATLEVRLGWLAFFGGEKEFDFEVAAAPPEEEGKVAHDFCPDCGRELQKGPQGTPVFCPWCGGKLREEAKSVSGQLVRTPWVKGFPRIRSARLTRLARPIRSARLTRLARPIRSARLTR
ncbi:MAG: hypothetical protein HWN51_03040, partial [Desulfobacterales bacterium]|nr:hypothetical protein [Desulfobacterales bacterium]